MKTFEKWLEQSLQWKAEASPIGAAEYWAGKEHKKQQQDNAATASAARAAAPKAKAILQPIEQDIEQKQLQQARETTLPAHSILQPKRQG